MPTPADQVRSKDHGQTKARADMIESTLEDHIRRGATRVTLSEYQGLSLGQDILGTGFLPTGSTYEAIQVVAQRYRNTGWNVRTDNSQRDGMFIIIDAERPA